MCGLLLPLAACGRGRRLPGAASALADRHSAGWAPGQGLRTGHLACEGSVAPVCAVQGAGATLHHLPWTATLDHLAARPAAAAQAEEVHGLAAGGRGSALGTRKPGAGGRGVVRCWGWVP